MIRELVSEKITEAINQMLPNAVGDIWLNENFLVFFKNVVFIQPANYLTDKWLGIAAIEGNVFVKLRSDEQVPMDPILLIAELLQRPIMIEPNETQNIAIQLKLKMTMWDDLVDENDFIPIISGSIEKGYLLKKNDNYAFQQPSRTGY